MNAKAPENCGRSGVPRPGRCFRRGSSANDMPRGSALRATLCFGAKSLWDFKAKFQEVSFLVYPLPSLVSPPGGPTVEHARRKRKGLNNKGAKKRIKKEQKWHSVRECGMTHPMVAGRTGRGIRVAEGSFPAQTKHPLDRPPPGLATHFRLTAAAADGRSDIWPWRQKSMLSPKMRAASWGAWKPMEFSDSMKSR